MSSKHVLAVAFVVLCAACTAAGGGGGGAPMDMASDPAVTDPLCAACGFDFTRLNTGDGAAIFIMQIAGGIVVFGALFVQVAYNPPIWAMLLVSLPLVAGLSLGLMRPGKGMMIALQMRNKAGRA